MSEDDEALTEWDREAVVSDAVDEIVRICEDCAMVDDVPNRDEIRAVLESMIESM